MDSPACLIAKCWTPVFNVNMNVLLVSFNFSFNVGKSNTSSCWKVCAIVGAAFKALIPLKTCKDKENEI